ncbi:EpsG family protein [Idiomarina sp. PL1-037]|uniref:EpsG family protein n=1 Tax=Idiomarina sp. PL1-037 TaxID=3095365 RepID=UPI002ACBDC64|nr:EpsG family protein [Idiomarina sp. PL1-037]WQC53501.1 EpsG family protein [Idiomarina sp. PL1-037]
MFFDDIKLPYIFLTFFGSLTLGFASLVYSVSNSQYGKLLAAFFCLSLSLIIAVLFGWRDISPGYGGIDTGSYIKIFASLEANDLTTIFKQRIEFGFGSFMWLVKSFGLSIHWFYFILGFSLLILIFYISTFLPITLFRIVSFFLLLLLFIDSFNISRMILAVFVLLLSCIFLMKGNYLKSIFTVLISASFQLVGLWGLIFIGYIFLKRKIKSKYTFIITYISLVFLSFVLVEAFKFLLVFIGYGYYIVDEPKFSLLNYMFCFYLFFVFYYFILPDKRYKAKKISVMVFNLLPTMVFTLPLYLAVPIAYRFNYIYMGFFFILIAETLKWSILKIKRRNIIGFLVAFIPSVCYCALKIYTYFDRDIGYAQVWAIKGSQFFGWW